MAILGQLEGVPAELAAEDLRSRLAEQVPLVEFLSLIFGAALLDAAAGRDPAFSQKATLEQFVELMGPGAAQSVAGTIHNFFEIRGFLINGPRNLK